MDLEVIYGLIGPCGVAIVVIGIAAVFICARSLIYTALSWREFKQRFLDVQRGDERCLRDYEGTNPFLRIIKDIVQTHASHSDDIRAEVAYLFNRNFKTAINGLSILKMITVISPLLGLLGTVSGMLMVFDAVSAAAAQNPEVLARGIWQALITTVMGLTVAIPTMVIYYFLSLRMRTFQIEAIEHSYRAIVITKQVHEKMAKE
ncbi:MotA/TolQ/ExbB proton channel family protein [Succinatimonas hippei]|uniref:MotA/TolQ/ExbB proton channel family protein n=1 Tax=Succinatimonas hippei TaxID=626938 RepID=UPI0026ED78B0|nr:MotA/TolQ/ExbB proton channel family protein [Succinatimonas hippei]